MEVDLLRVKAFFRADQAGALFDVDVKTYLPLDCG